MDDTEACPSPLNHSISLTSPQILNAIYIREPEVDDPPIHSRDDLAEMLDPSILVADKNGRLLENEINDRLNTKASKVVGSFFDRDPKKFLWYYTIFAREDAQGRLNEVATALASDKHAPIYGPAVLVKDSAVKHWDTLDKSVDLSEVTKTVWYWFRNRGMAEEDFGTRTLMRVLAEDEV